MEKSLDDGRWLIKNKPKYLFSSLKNALGHILSNGKRDFTPLLPTHRESPLREI